MAEETVIVEEKKKVKEREPLFSKKNKKLITDPLDENNPVTCLLYTSPSPRDDR